MTELERAVLRAYVIHKVAEIYRDRRIRGRVPRSLALRYPLRSTR